MATEVEITTAIDTAQSQQGLSNLRKGLKDLISLQQQVGKDSSNFGKLQQAINKTEGKIGDLTDSFKTLRGSGIERINSSLGLFREGLLNADTGKLKAGLEGVGTAMKAIPIFLLIEGVQFLIGNWDKLTASFSESAKQAKENEKALKDLTYQVDAQRISIERNLLVKESELKALQNQGAGLGLVIGKLKEIDQLKQDGITGELKKVDKEAQNIIATIQDLKNNSQLSDLLPDFLGGDATQNKIDELFKKLEDLQLKRGNLTNQQKAQEIKTAEDISAVKEEAGKKELAEREERIKKIQDILKAKNELEASLEQDRIRVENEELEKELASAIKFIEERKRAKQDEADFLAALQEGAAIQEAAVSEAINADNLKRFRNHAAEEQAAVVETNAEKIAQIQLLRDEELAKEELTVEQRVAIIKKGEADILAIRTASQLQNISIAQQYVQVLTEVNNLANQNQLRDLKKLEIAKEKSIANGSKTQIQAETEYLQASLKIKKQQFEKEKGLKIANIAIDTASALVKTTAQLGGVGALTPAGVLMLGGITALGVSQALVVANQDFDDSGFTPPQLPSLTSSGSGSDPSPDRTPERTPTVFNPQAQVNGNNGGTTRVVVLQGDIKDTMNKVDVLESRATFGM